MSSRVKRSAGAETSAGCIRYARIGLKVGFVFSILLLMKMSRNLEGGQPPTTTKIKLDNAGPVKPEYLQTDAMRKASLNFCPPSVRLETQPDMTLPQFISRTFESINQVIVGERPLFYLAKNFNKTWRERGGLANGFWAEFGVYNGGSLKNAFKMIKNDLPQSSGLVFAGFDSFEGLPAKWRSSFNEGKFNTSYDAVRADVPAEVELHKGWFQDTIGQFLIKHPDIPASFIHHDGDLFVSTAITFSLLASRIFPGTMMCFDELVGYPGFEQHEILSLFLWMQEYHATICPVGIKERYNDTDKNPLSDLRPDRQSVCFQVLTLKK